ncbi:hypothetical protein QTG56_26165 (plasmid) [Rossellomorea sp. AcN35-11]|nr:hypothetical protein [Rossellomorea aquimaris]WJV32103.1 hypothetical protein QTG56_26165 [Rossellomorea sp. AcN35-11]
MRKRQGLNMKSLDRQAELARKRGLKHKDMTGRLHKWVLSVRGKDRDNEAKYIVYNNSLFVFHRDYSKVITVITVPGNLMELVSKQSKRHHNNNPIVN